MIGYDKVLHFLCCLGITLGVWGITTPIASFETSLVAGVWASIGASIGKEYGDSQAKNNYWSWGDIIADSVGIIVGVGLAYLIRLIIV